MDGETEAQSSPVAYTRARCWVLDISSRRPLAAGGAANLGVLFSWLASLPYGISLAGSAEGRGR